MAAPLHYAIAREHVGAVRLLIESGAESNDYVEVYIAIKYKGNMAIKRILSEFDIEIRDGSNSVFTLYHGDLMRELLAHGAIIESCYIVHRPCYIRTFLCISLVCD